MDNLQATDTRHLYKRSECACICVSVSNAQRGGGQFPSFPRAMPTPTGAHKHANYESALKSECVCVRKTGWQFREARLVPQSLAKKGSCVCENQRELAGLGRGVFQGVVWSKIAEDQPAAALGVQEGPRQHERTETQ